MSSWSSSLVLCLTCAAMLFAQGPTPSQEKQLRENASVLRAALPLLYPTLSTQPVDVYPDWDAGMTTVLGAIGVPVRRTQDAAVGPLQVEANVVRGYLTWMKAVGLHVHTSELDQLATKFTQSRGTLDELARALRERGAKFGPDRGAPKLEGKRRRELEQVFGKMAIKEARFEWVDTHNLAYVVDAPVWRVVVEATPIGSTPRCVDLVFEPISGELVHIFTSYDVRGNEVLFQPCRG